MRDRILGSYLVDFQKEHDLEDLGEPDAFEHFCNYCVISREFRDPFDIEEVAVGGGADTALDGIAILVNDNLVFSIEDVDYFKSQLRRFEVKFVFVQSKTSDSFDLGDIGNFLSGVQAFFDDSSQLPTNPDVARFRSIKNHIYKSSIDMDENPQCRLHYITTGKWLSDKTLVARIDAETERLRETSLFSSVEFDAIDAERLRNIYKGFKHGTVREIVFEKHTILPVMHGVQEAYIGIVPCSEYLKLITDSDGRLNHSLFYDNVRDFQGNNSVNVEMEETLKDHAQRDRFALLNNGVTLVAKSVNKVGASFRLKDFQVVNGCQSSHVLYRNRDHLHAQSYIPLKLVVTDDSEVAVSVTRATNRQTEVRPEAFESLTPFQKNLEEFYLTYGRSLKHRLYYERRSKQFDHKQVALHQVISLTAQLKCFLGMFLNEPQSTHRYYGELLTSYRSRLFQDGHSPMPYFTSAYSFYLLERLLRGGTFPKVAKALRYQILMVSRLLAAEENSPALNSRKIDAYCDRIMQRLLKEDDGEALFQEASQLVLREFQALQLTPRGASQLKSFTARLVDVATGRSLSVQQPQADERTSGTVVMFSDIKGYGFIEEAGTGGRVFVHFTGIRGDGYRKLIAGQKVSFVRVDNPRGIHARDVTTSE